MQFISDLMTSLMIRIQDVRHNVRQESGQTLVEYGLILALIAVVAIVALETIGGGVRDTFNDISDKLGGGGGEDTTE